MARDEIAKETGDLIEGAIAGADLKKSVAKKTAKVYVTHAALAVPLSVAWGRPQSFLRQVPVSKTLNPIYRANLRTSFIQANW